MHGSKRITASASVLRSCPLTSVFVRIQFVGASPSGKLDTTNADQRPVVIPARIGLGRVLVNTHRAKEALPVLESAVAMSRERQGPTHWRTGEAEVVLARCWMELGRADSAEAPLRDAQAVLDKQRRSHPLLGKEADIAGDRFAQMRTAK